MERNPQQALAYFYCEYSTPETQKLLNVLGSLVKQICVRSEDAFTELERLYSQREENGKLSSLPPTNKELGDLLKRISRYFDDVIVTTDGLNECRNPEDQNQILEYISSLNAPEHGTLKAIYTIRDEIDIREQLSDFKPISIAARGNDLELFVAAGIESRIKNKQLKLKDPTMKEIIIKNIITKANGMYDTRWRIRG